MDVFGILVCGQQAVFIALELLQAAQCDGAEGIDWGHLRAERRGLGAERLLRDLAEQRVAALSLAHDGGAQIKRFLQDVAESEDVAHHAADQFEFDLADGCRASVAFDLAAVQHQFDQRLSDRHMPRSGGNRW